MDLATRLEIVQLYYANSSSPSLCLRAYKTRHNLKSDPFQPAAISKLIQKFETTFSLHDMPKPGRPSTIDADKVDAVKQSHLNQANNNNIGKSSLKQCERDTGICYSTVRKITKEHLNYKKFKPRFVHELQDGDPDHRLEFVDLFFTRLLPVLDDILWTDEAHFHLSGELSTLSGYLWAPENPNMTISRPLHSQRMTVAVAFSSKFLLPPYFFPYGQPIRKEQYVEMVRDHIIPNLKAKRKFRKTYFMQDGATPHTARYTIDFLKDNFGDRVISRTFDLFWPPRSPDLTPCDFWFWGDIKNKVYSKTHVDLESLKESIVHEFNNIDPVVLETTVHSIPDRLTQLRLVNGEHL